MRTRKTSLLALVAARLPVVGLLAAGILSLAPSSPEPASAPVLTLCQVLDMARRNHRAPRTGSTRRSSTNPGSRRSAAPSRVRASCSPSLAGTKTSVAQRRQILQAAYAPHLQKAA